MSDCVDTAIIACKTIEDELCRAMEETALNYPVTWIESGLHNTPKKLTAALQTGLDCMGADRVLVALGFCGNSVLGLRSGDFELIIPRVDDCISLLIGSAKERAKISGEHAAYFLTEGWLRGERNLWVEYQYTREKYGDEIAQSISEAMFGHYRTLGLLDCGVNQIEALVESTKIIADTLKLTQRVIPATISYIKQLLTGPWPDDKFVVKAPHETVSAEDLTL